ncbi:ABC transporter releated protein [Methanocaldococcus vulcanius M7]|uniref:ABC transporter releated protein n=1 Tax=Methanocaldococcus vulcanius (strain ATCC 700851 / DSM 12094 / M7) TaxID=579137 RepID=C9RDM3_METVM|nr:ABC transporter ATP-binding protein [Methanocaldococcus vulcanius]ACX73402.1 ABC transporter releated protein [Methanocaldococcus vulcanius M7]
MLLKIENLHVCRGKREILKGVNLDVKENEIHAIIGPNGAGKSTLAYTLMGISGYSPSKGNIIFKGERINEKNITERARMGMTLAWQEPARFEGIKVKNYLTLGMKETYKKDKETMEKKIREALKLVNLDPDKYLDRYVDETLSGGERKRIELASIVCMEPDLAILDEPDSGIDIVSFDEIKRVFDYLKDRGCSLLVITHREELAEHADRVSLICAGEVIKSGNPKEVGEFYKKECGKCYKKVPEGK